MILRRTTLSLLGLGAALAVLLVVYLPTLQTIPNGSENYYMIDVGETQIVLNRWGTLHATGYPLYVMIGSTGVALLRAFGIDPATAPALVSLFWGLVALSLIYVLSLHVTHRPLIAAAVTILYGLTRTVWIHNDIAEIYSMTLCLLVLLLVLALWTPPVPGRLYWLALIGGIAVAHHRALIMVAPALIYAVYPDLTALIRKRPAALLGLIGLGLLGLLPYIYMYMRAQTGEAWVYGEPGTMQGLVDQFMGKEANRFVGLPASLDALSANFSLVNSVILTDVTLPGLIAGVIGLVIGIFTHRRAAVTLILSGGAAYLFHVFFYSDILSALILAVTLSLAFGWLFLADRLMSVFTRPYIVIAPVILIAVVFGVALYRENALFIDSLTGDTTGLETIRLAQHTPPRSTLMLAWGPRYFAVGFARDVLGLLPGIRLADHKADYSQLLHYGELVTPEYTFYNQPVSWWEGRIGARVYLRALAPKLVQIDTEPELWNNDTPGVIDAAHRIECLPDKIILRVAWHTETVPERDLSVFVHLLNVSSSVIAQDDHNAPVYGWRPLTTWVAQEVVRDVYTLPRLPDAEAVSYGLYEQRADGSFNNVVSYTLPVECG